MIKKSDFNYKLPEHLIAQHPLARRDASRLLVMAKDSKALHHRHFYELPNFLRAGDCLVVNNSKVMPARLLGKRSDTETAVEVLLLKRLSDDTWETLVKPGRRVRTGHRLVFIPDRLMAEVIDMLPSGNRVIRFEYEGLWEAILDEAGTMPLPPYIHEQLDDPSRYQTVYAKQQGSAAAPTAGLHFTPELLKQLQDKGVQLAEVTLHVGLGTFRPVKSESIEDHEMHAEFYQISNETAAIIRDARQNGGRVIAVGTTSCRVIESVAAKHGALCEDQGWTDIFIYPGYTFKALDGLITNFHLPESTLIMLVSALVGRESVLAAYEEAVRQEYRFFSFGDAMFILPGVDIPDPDIDTGF